MEGLFEPRRKSLMEAGYDAARIAYAPIAFQVARVLRDSGVLECVAKSGIAGITIQDVAVETDVSEYGVRVLLEGGLSMGLVYENGDRYIMTKTGNFILNDEMTRVNMDFVHDVCYKPMFHLDKAIEEGEPSGLSEFGDWETVYEALSQLPEQIRKSWFGFDHFYSDSAFPAALPLIFKDKPKKLMDIGGNTGKWALQCVEYDPDVQVTIVDLPGQWGVAEKNVKERGFEGRVTGYPLNVLDPSQPFPKGHDAVWMSQFLVCFSLDEIEHIIQRAADALDENGTLYILDTHCDRQQNEIASYCLIQTSLYFTTVANGNSQMYRAGDIIERVEKAGMKVVEDIDGVGLSHTLFKCRKQG